MADATPNTDIVRPKVRSALQPSATMALFSELLVALAALVEAERDLEHFDRWGQTGNGWLRDAERAFTRVTTLITRIRGRVALLPGDLALQRVALLIDRMIGSEEPGSFGRIHAQLHRYDALFACRGSGPMVRRVNALLGDARRRIDELATLATFIDAPFVDDRPLAGPDPHLV